MTNPTPAETPFSAAIAAAVEATSLPKAERMKIHRRNIQSIAFHEGLNGVAKYKSSHPEAATIRVQNNPLAYEPKPAGYDQQLVSMVERWLIHRPSLEASNVHDVALINERLGTSYPPAKHFCQKLTKGRLAKIKTTCSHHGIPLDIKTANTMSRVRQAIKAAKGQLAGERRLGSAGVVSNGTLVLGGKSYPVERNGKRECIRVMIGGKRQRVYFDVIEWLADQLGVCGDDPLNTTVGVGELAYSGKTSEIGHSAEGRMVTLATTNISDDRNAEPTHHPEPLGDPLELDPRELAQLRGTV